MSGDGYTYRLHVNIPASNLPSISTLSPNNLALKSIYPALMTIQGANLGDATSVITYPPGRILVTDFQATAFRVDAHVVLAANTPTGIYSIFVATPFGISNGLA